MSCYKVGYTKCRCHVLFGFDYLNYRPIITVLFDKCTCLPNFDFSEKALPSSEKTLPSKISAKVDVGVLSPSLSNEYCACKPTRQNMLFLKCQSKHYIVLLPLKFYFDLSLAGPIIAQLEVFFSSDYL